MSLQPSTIESILRFKVIILWIIAIILIAYFIFFSIKHSVIPSNGFATYYTASRLLVEGENPANFYNNEYFSSNVKKYVPGIYEIYLVNLPLTPVLFLPLTFFDHITARIIWTIFNLLVLAFTFIFILRKMNFNQAWLPFILILFFTFQPLYENIIAAQIYILIFCMMFIVFIGYTSCKNIHPGIITGIILMIKSAGTFLLVLFAVQKKWKILLWTAITILFLFSVTLPFLGFESWIEYVKKLIEFTSSPALSVTAYQSVHSFFYHFFVFDAKWNPEPLFYSAITGKLLTIIFNLSILIVTILLTIKYKKSDLAFSIFVIIGIILSPASIDYHYVIILIPVLILLDWLRKNQSKILWILFLFSFALIAADIPYTSPKVTNGILTLLAYPKLYGAIGLWILNVTALRDKSKEIDLVRTE